MQILNMKKSIEELEFLLNSTIGYMQVVSLNKYFIVSSIKET